jgi:hypothetical protein
MNDKELAIAVLRKFTKLADDNAVLMGIFEKLRVNNAPLNWLQMMKDITSHPSYRSTIHEKYDPLEQSILRAADTEEAFRVLLLGLLQG